MEALKTLGEPTTCLQIVSKHDPSRLVIKYKGPTPTKGCEGSAYFNLRNAQSINLEPETNTLINMGLRIEIPKGYGLWMPSRSKLVWECYTVEGGVIDSDYRGEVKVLIHNNTINAG